MYQQLEKNLLNGNMSSTYPHNMVNFRSLTAEICWWVWDTAANFNRFCVFALLLHWHRSRMSTKLCTVFGHLLGWYIIYTFLGALATIMEFFSLQNSICIQVLPSPILAVLLHGTSQLASAKLSGMVQGMELLNFHRGPYLYSAERRHIGHWPTF